MIRLLVRLILLLLAFALVRSMIKTILAMIAPAAKSAHPRAPSARSGGELKKDPVCGTFVAEAASVKKTVDGEIMHFCSASCRDKYKVA